MALAEYREMGHFSSALRRARQTYAERRAALVQALTPCLQDPLAGVYVGSAEQGLHLHGLVMGSAKRSWPPSEPDRRPAMSQLLISP